MAKAEIRNEILFKAPTRIGLLADVTGALLAAGVNITAIGAYDKGDTAEFLLLTSDNRLTGEALAPLGGEVGLVPVVVAELDNRPGELAAIARRLADAGINVEQIHATSTDAPTMTIVMLTSDEIRVIGILRDE
ncbi:MAG: ACT domain-containing protein [Actinobacteria bacterium]|nr:ACT domain-containing protein [Actinomycetota bacterium]